MADKSKKKPEIEDADVVDSTDAKTGGKPTENNAGAKADAVKPAVKGTDSPTGDTADTDDKRPKAQSFQKNASEDKKTDTASDKKPADEKAVAGNATAAKTTDINPATPATAAATGASDGSKPADPVSKPKEKPATDPVIKPEPEPAVHNAEEESEEDDIGSSFAAKVLRALALIVFGIVVALWGAPKVAPMLPAGLSPVAEFLMPGQSEARAEVAALRSDLESRLAELEQAPQDGVNQETIDAAIAQYAQSQQEELAAIKDRLAATDGVDIESRVASLESRIEGVEAELTAVGERLSAQITENGATLSEEAASKLSGFQATLQGLKAQVADLAAKNGALNQKVEEAAKAAARRVEEAEKQASSQVASTATKKLLTDITVALDSGTPFRTALDGLVELTGTEVPDVLEAVADTGTPSWTTLRNRFSDRAHAALRADTKANAGDGVAGKLGAFLKTQVGTRSIERRDGDSADAILSRVEDDLVNRRLAAALSEANSLPEAAKAAMSQWIADLSALNAAQSALTDLNASLGAT
ncbi:MAG: hypothetical protein GYB24_17460 [Rhodobacteraceae bacterium]|nr:hypothetical protein [Paracoccaceae bacterium]